MSETLKKPDNRGLASPFASAQERLILVAEKLFAKSGIDAVPLREIARSAGNGNNNAVQYHFGSREGIVKAIFSYRIHQLAMMRTALLAESGARGETLDLKRIVRAWLLPVAQLVDENGKHTYAAFMSHYVLQSVSSENPFVMANTPAEAASLRQSVDLIVAALPDVPRQTLLERIQLTYLTFANMLVRHDKSDPAGDTATLHRSIQDTLACTVAYLSSPVPR